MVRTNTTASAASEASLKRRPPGLQNGGKKTRKKKSSSSSSSSSSFLPSPILTSAPPPPLPFPRAGTRSAEALEWLLSPVSVSDFFSQYWARTFLHIPRKDPQYYDRWDDGKGVYSKKTLFEVLKAHSVEYTKQLNVARLEGGKKKVYNPSGRALPKEARSFFEQGCTLQLLAPQHHSDSLAKLNSFLEDCFGCLVGANAYLTPPKAQGFAPHYDDVDVFIVQVEGSKEWRLNELPSANQLPRDYSPDFTEEEVSRLTPHPCITITLHPGDLLYLPRGVIHRAKTGNDAHSLHVTVSTYQQWTWYDLLQTAVPLALDVAVKQDREFREGLPVDFHAYMGTGYGTTPLSSAAQSSTSSIQSQSTTPTDATAAVQAFQRTFHRLLERLPAFANIHEAADVHALPFLANRLPPNRCLLTPQPSQRKKGAQGGPSTSTSTTSIPLSLRATTLIRLRNPSWVRMVIDTDMNNTQQCFMYHCCRNTRDSNMVGDELKDVPNHLVFPLSHAAALASLFSSHPKHIAVGELHNLDESQRLECARSLQTADLLDVVSPDV
eukprot:NODE_292_length_1837_cov_20.778523_g235_i0.p1 GENE.NODE_292_length_1837_cov_20.778523_g235_i0~~NODE_292_length_1837_cov_20.778523_g235_i0.p1  ORF type:complete len:551 (-),score=140.74 NODE_292_length_1837_cov_20.778523_g235_i0:86-1738(-)